VLFEASDGETNEYRTGDVPAVFEQ
jgi:hypothetical protein